MRVVVSGTYRKDLKTLRDDFEFLSQHSDVLSPESVQFVDFQEGFARSQDEIGRRSAQIESDHLSCITHADMMSLHAPNGHLGVSAAVEVGWACALGVRVFSRSHLQENQFDPLIEIVPSPKEALSKLEGERVPQDLNGLSSYYKRVAERRGWRGEDAQECIELLEGEVDELKRALKGNGDIREEAADVQLYLVHLANILRISLSEAVADKERMNTERFG